VTALLTVYNSAGPVGTCDAICYDAKFPTCRCVCRSRNHGVGRAQAEINSRELAAFWKDYGARLGGLPFDRVEIDFTVATDPLF
jgi:hypothetical protein